MEPTPILMSPILERALRRCACWHHGQARKGAGGIPYVEHVVGVALILDRAGFPEPVVVAGLLHDAVEDADVTVEQVRQEFGPEVARIVADCSERKHDAQGAKRPWIDRKTEHLAHLERAPVDSRAVALADKLHNLTSILVDLEDGGDVWSIFNADRAQVFWYYRAAIARYRLGDPRLQQLAAACEEMLGRIESHIQEAAENAPDEKTAG